MEMNYAQLKFPPYDWLKKLPLTEKYTYRDRITRQEVQEDTYKEYYFTLFTTRQMSTVDLLITKMTLE